MVICVTGHRPSKLPSFGYHYSAGKWRVFMDLSKALLRRYHCDIAVSGMALGVDTAFALAVLEMKAEGYPVQLHCAIPCLGQTAKWPKQSVDLYNQILSRADTAKIITEEPYRPYLMQKRNEYMVDLSDMVIALWDGTKGGTGNCVEYAKKNRKPLIWIDPQSMSITRHLCADHTAP